MKKIAIISLVLLFLIQFVPVDRSVPSLDSGMDFLDGAPSTEGAVLVKNACYDCHSYSTEYPWYSRVKPVAWWLQNHIKHGRKHFNFSEWQSYSSEDQNDILEECIEEIRAGKMPLGSYKWAHSEARLSQEQTETLVQYLRSRMP